MPRISEQRRQERRDQILEAARALFTENGFHATSMDDIVRAAGMSAGGVYRHFPSKESLVTAIAEGVVAEVSARVEEILRREPLPPLPEALTLLITVIDDLAGRSGRLAVQVWGETQRDPAIAAVAAKELARIRSAVTELVAREQAAGQSPEGPGPEVFAQVLFCLGPGYLVQKLIIGDVEPRSFATALASLLRPAATGADPLRPSATEPEA